MTRASVSTPIWIRTRNLRFRRPMLYPIELWVLAVSRNFSVFLIDLKANPPSSLRPPLPQENIRIFAMNDGLAVRRMKEPVGGLLVSRSLRVVVVLSRSHGVAGANTKGPYPSIGCVLRDPRVTRNHRHPRAWAPGMTGVARKTGMTWVHRRHRYHRTTSTSHACSAHACRACGTLLHRTATLHWTTLHWTRLPVPASAPCAISPWLLRVHSWLLRDTPWIPAPAATGDLRQLRPPRSVRNRKRPER